MTRVFKFVALLLVLLVSGRASAEVTDEGCTDEIRAIVGREMKIDALVPRIQDGNIVSESCKSWSYNSAVVLSAFAYDAGVEYEKTLVVAMIDKKTKHVVSSYQIVISEDVITEVGDHSLKLDTARYQLAKGVRAFGLRFNSSARGPSCGEAHWNDELTLLVPEGKKLRPVLRLDMYQQQSIQGCLSGQVPDAIWQDANITIAIERSSTNGFYDLLAKAAITYSANEGASGASLENLKDHTEQHVLRYNGKFYEKGKNSPWWLGSW